MATETRPEPVPVRDGRLRLPDGRWLGYAEYGDLDGRPVLWFAGTPGARRQIPPAAPAEAAARGLRIIALERPGIGLSTHHPDRTLHTWADDVTAACDALGLDRVALIGLSGGGPHVLAVAHDLGPDRIVCGAVLGGLGPTIGDADAGGYPAALRMVWRNLHHVAEPLGAAVSAAVRPARRIAGVGFDAFLLFWPAVDRPVLSSPSMKAMFLTDLVGASAHSVRSAIVDLAVFGRPWGFDVADIDVPIRIWHGTADPTVPFSHGEWLTAQIPGASLVEIPDEGHFAGFVRPAEVLDWCAAEWDLAAGADSVLDLAQQAGAAIPR